MKRESSESKIAARERCNGFKISQELSRSGSSYKIETRKNKEARDSLLRAKAFDFCAHDCYLRACLNRYFFCFVSLLGSSVYRRNGAAGREAPHVANKEQRFRSSSRTAITRCLSLCLSTNLIHARRIQARLCTQNVIVFSLLAIFLRRRRATNSRRRCPAPGTLAVTGNSSNWGRGRTYITPAIYLRNNYYRSIYNESLTRSPIAPDNQKIKLLPSFLPSFLPCVPFACFRFVSLT